MRNALYFLPILISVLFAGCGTPQQGSWMPVTDNRIEDEIPTVILYPKGYEPRDIEEDRGRVDHRTDIYADLSFSGVETEHVKVRGVNPLPVAGVLEVNLDGLRDGFVYPYKGNFLSDYGPRDGRQHTGVDIKTVPNDTIRAVLPGVVRMSKEYSSYGNIVVIQHYCGFETVYAHCSRNLVRVNDRVSAGTPVGLAGRTGRATTEHLHFEVRVAGNPIDPKLLLDIEGQGLRRGMLYATEHEGTIIAYNDPAQFERIKQGRETQAEERPNVPKTIPDRLVEIQSDDTPPNPLPGSFATGTATQSSQAAYHTVTSGDTLYEIARRYSTTVKELCRLNGISENGILSLGQKIRYR